MRLLQVSFCLLMLVAPLSAGEYQLLPPRVHLTAQGSGQQLLLVKSEQSRIVAEVTADATFRSGDPSTLQVTPNGFLTGLKNGTTTVTASIHGHAIQQTVTVSGFEKPREVSFLYHVQPTLTRTGCNSGACHGALAGKGGFKLSLRGYDSDSDYFTCVKQALNRRVDLAKPADSLLLRKAMRTLPHGGGTRFDQDSIYARVLWDWIQRGAPGPRSDEPNLQKLELFPASIRLPLKASASVLVQATFSDGHTEDVTRWAKFVSSEEQTATVDEEGRITVAGHGEAGISASFGNLVATMTVTVPYDQQIPTQRYTSAPRTNFIDELILQKLQQLNLEPSPIADDRVFIRRVYLDVAGILPKPDEVRQFLADSTPDKRAKLIDQLLSRSEYVDYWSHKWSDLLLVSSRKLPSGAMWAFYRSIRQSVADNQPWDQFARQILTAQGSNLNQGGGNYFVIHKDLAELTEATAVTFLGLSIGCAKCHNHPLEKWTQDQYWAMANVFGRVGLKNGSSAEETLIQTLPQGEVLHPRTARPMPPAALGATPLPLTSSIDRRQYFVDWLTKPENPFFAKAIVNRVWRALMGRGLVEAEDDLRETNPPTNRELFDALATSFTQSGYDIKQLIRLIVSSASYQRSSDPLPTNLNDDRYYSRYLIRRLPAEVILDAYSDVTNVPTPFNTLSLGPSGGTAAANYPLGTRAMQLPDSLLISRFLDAFGRAERLQTCSCERTADASVSQALHLNNGQSLNDKLRDPKSRLSHAIQTKKSDSEIVQELFLAALSRQPTEPELSKFVALLAEAGRGGAKERQEALEDVFWAVLTGKEFLFNH